MLSTVYHFSIVRWLEEPDFEPFQYFLRVSLYEALFNPQRPPFGTLNSSSLMFQLQEPDLPQSPITCVVGGLLKRSILEIN